MHSHEDAPPPYPGVASSDIPIVVTSKGDYRGVPVYQMGPNNPSVCKLSYSSYFKRKKNEFSR
jgi:hypothetical protein